MHLIVCILKTFSSEMKIQFSFRDLNPGDHLAVPGKTAGIEYFHHGIFIEFKKGVVEFSGITKSKAEIKLVDLKIFINGDHPLYRINYSKNKRLANSKTVETAMGFAQYPESWEPYNLLLNNCEHFASFCVTGKKSSQQVTTAIRNGLSHMCKEVGSPSPSPLS